VAYFKQWYFYVQEHNTQVQHTELVMCTCWYFTPFSNDWFLPVYYKL